MRFDVAATRVDQMNNRTIFSVLSGCWLALMCLTTPAHAGSTSENTQIAQVAISKSYSGIVFVRVASTPTNRPACSSGYWHYILTLTNPGDREMYATLLAAMHSRASVNVYGLGSCNDYSAAETLTSLHSSPG